MVVVVLKFSVFILVFYSLVFLRKNDMNHYYCNSFVLNERSQMSWFAQLHIWHPSRLNSFSYTISISKVRMYKKFLRCNWNRYEFAFSIPQCLFCVSMFVSVCSKRVLVLQVICDCVCLCVSVSLSVYVYVGLFQCRSVCLFLSLSVCVSLSLCICLSLFLTFFGCVYLGVTLCWLRVWGCSLSLLVFVCFFRGLCAVSLFLLMSVCV